MIPRQGLAFLLTVLLAVPAWAAPGRLGTIADSQSAFIRGTEVIVGSTVFNGDTVSVGRGGSAWVTLPGGAQIRLGENSEAELGRTDRAVRLDLRRGHATFRVAAETPIEGLVGDATFRAAQDGPGVGVISYLNANKVFLFAEQGNWIIRTARDGASLMLHQGEGTEATLGPAQAGTTAGSEDTTPPRKRRGVFVIVLTSGLIIGGATAAALALNEGESHIGIQQSQPVVSPFVP